MVKNLPVVQETWVPSWVGKIPWRREWQPTRGFLPGESCGRRDLGGCNPCGRKELDITELLIHTHTYVKTILLDLILHGCSEVLIKEIERDHFQSIFLLPKLFLCEIRF